MASKLTNITYENTGGGVMCFSALYNDRYWVFGSTSGTASAYSVDPMSDEHWEDFMDYEIKDATEFPTWREVIEALRGSDAWEFYGRMYGDPNYVENEAIYFQEDLDRPVNIEI
jgi:hypothetical protein